VSELRLAHSSARVAELERALRSSAPGAAPAAPSAPPASDSRALDHWFPVAHAAALSAATLHPFDLFGRAWLLFRDASARAACLADACAHRACPLSLGKNVNGRVQCAYHGWEFAPGGGCEHMPSTPFLPGVTVSALPVVEQDGLLWVWPGRGTPAAVLPRLAPPRGFTLVASAALDVERDADALIAALLAAAGPGGVTTTLPTTAATAQRAEAAQAGRPPPPAQQAEPADGAGLVAAAARALRGSGGSASPAAVAFLPPGAVVSTLTLGADADPSLTQPADDGDGDDDGAARRVHVLFACVPALPGRTRVLYRLAVNFASAALATAPGAGALWQALADDLLREQIAALDAADGAQAGPPAGASAAADAFADWRRAMME